MRILNACVSLLFEQPPREPFLIPITQLFTLDMAISFVVANMFPFKMVSVVILLLHKIVKKTCTP